MEAFLSSITVTDRINVTLCVLSFVLSAISVVAVVLSLRQNNKMIEASTRPYLAVSYTILHPEGSPATYIMIKNYGNTGTRIIDFKCSISDGNLLDRQLPRIPGTYFAPGQKVLYYFDQKHIVDEMVSFEYSYTNGKKKYSDSQEVRIKTGAMTVRGNEAMPAILLNIAEQLL